MSDETLAREQAAQIAADGDRLLPGEATASGLGPVADALHWLRVYGELLTFKDELIGLTRARMEGMSEAAQVEARSDEVRMEQEAQRFRRRIAVWRGRLEDLRADGRAETSPGGA
jgi:hypothetical protein